MEVGGALREAAEDHAGHAAGADKMGEYGLDRQWGGAMFGYGTVRANATDAMAKEANSESQVWIKIRSCAEEN